MLTWPKRTFDKSEGSGGPVDLMRPAPPRRPTIGIALGAGAARGWAHIGVLTELVANDIHPDVVAGTSIGAVVGACYAGGKLAELEAFARSITKRGVFSYMDWSLSGMGLISGNKLRNLLASHLPNLRIEDAPRRFAAVATEVDSGHEIWLTRGDMVQAVAASYALPGIFEPVKIGGRWLFDGALVNPVPVTVCRALGAECVIAVNLVADTMFRGIVRTDVTEVEADVQPEPTTRSGRTSFGALRLQFGRRADGAPGLASAMIDAFNITQDRISRSRLAGDPPDVMVRTRLGTVGLFDFHRAGELIELGRDAVRNCLPELRAHLEPTVV